LVSGQAQQGLSFFFSGVIASGAAAAGAGEVVVKEEDVIFRRKEKTFARHSFISLICSAHEAAPL